ncbi:ABC transporter ATP-binding protein [Hellea balneolensis]|uniref:ABC transporter ATP-binding protein n=1 Tax=Hellea balneolensis TaxID=287478 RepID=UPI0004796D8E|nr:ABC transporter ATP-binding protein [Hellea balneolensis]
MSTDSVLTLTDLQFGYSLGPNLIDIPHFEIKAGESVFLRGPSGSGKSTLLGLIGGVLTPQSGKISICGKELTEISSGQRDKIRADHLGIIFQQFNLLPYIGVIQNCILPCRFSASRRNRALRSSHSVEAEAEALTSGLGLTDEDLKRKVGELSVGQQQRVAVARALIGGPDLIIADEPTSALDHDNRDRFIELLNQSREKFGSSLLFVSHDQTLASHFDRAVSLTELNQRVAA